MTGGAVWWAWLVGVALGALAALLWRARREQASRIETEVLRARLKTEEAVSAEREQALSRAREQLQGVFGELAREQSGRATARCSLQLARERLARQQQDASQALKSAKRRSSPWCSPFARRSPRPKRRFKRSSAIGSNSFATLKTQMEALALGQTSLSRETRNLVTALRRPNVRGQWARSPCAGCRVVPHDLARRLYRAGASQHRLRRRSARHGGAHAEQRDNRRGCENAARCLPRRRSKLKMTRSAARNWRRHAHNRGRAGSRAVLEAVLVAIRTQPGFRVLFLPGDQFLCGGAARNPGLVDDSMRQNVMLATPTS